MDVEIGEDGGVRIAVTDNGHGFDTASVASIGHQGLANMRSRAAGIGATIDFESGPGGTTVRVILPPESDPDRRWSCDA